MAFVIRRKDKLVVLDYGAYKLYIELTIFDSFFNLKDFVIKNLKDVGDIDDKDFQAKGVGFVAIVSDNSLAQSVKKIKDNKDRVDVKLPEMPVLTEDEPLENLIKTTSYLSSLERFCKQKRCALFFTKGAYSPFEGVEVKILGKDESYLVIVEFEHIKTGIIIGTYSKEIAAKIGELDVVIGDGLNLVDAVEEFNPVYLVLIGHVDEYKAKTGVASIEQSKNLKVSIKRDQRDIMGLKTVYLEA